jgi:hypothetical protein
MKFKDTRSEVRTRMVLGMVLGNGLMNRSFQGPRAGLQKVLRLKMEDDANLKTEVCHSQMRWSLATLDEVLFPCVFSLIVDGTDRPSTDLAIPRAFLRDL